MFGAKLQLAKPRVPTETTPQETVAENECLGQERLDQSAQLLRGLIPAI